MEGRTRNLGREGASFTHTVLKHPLWKSTISSMMRSSVKRRRNKEEPHSKPRRRPFSLLTNPTTFGSVNASGLRWLWYSCHYAWPWVSLQTNMALRGVRLCHPCNPDCQILYTVSLLSATTWNTKMIPEVSKSE